MAWSAVLCLSFVTLSVCSCPAEARSEVTVLQLLVVLPQLQDGGGGATASASWERGLEILPAAHIAVERINQEPNILSGYQLELVEIGSHNCRQSGVQADTLAEFIERTVHTTAEQGVVGMVGLFCPRAVELLSPLAGRKGFSLLHISGSASEQLYNQHAYPALYHIVQSSDVYIDSLLGLMKGLEWNRIGVISEREDPYFNRAADLLIGAPNVTISGAFYPSPSFTVFDIVKPLAERNSKVNFVSLSATLTIELLCTVYRAGYTWPEYAWILHSLRVKDLLTAAADCDIWAALEGVILLQQELETDAPLSPLVSGETYSEYRARYLERLAQVSQERNVTLRGNLQANLLHDSVWAFALALNKSTEILQSLNQSLSDYRFGDEDTTAVISEQLSRVSFAGASNSRVELSTGKDQAESSVGILQFLNGTVNHVAQYYSGMTVIVNISFNGTIPDDDLPIIRTSLPLQSRIVLYVINFLTFSLVTITLVLYILFRKEPDIKASSFFISLFMYFGCYVLLVYLLVVTLDLRSDTTDFCQAVGWLNGLGYVCVLAALFVKMLRVYRVFSHFGKTGKVWSDKILVLLFFLMISPVVLVLVIWTAVDKYHLVFVYISFPGYTEIADPCESNYLPLWVSFLYTYAGIVAIALITVAVKTRKIRKKNFKDTKKVNAYLYLQIMIMVLSLAYWAVLRTVSLVLGSIALFAGHLMSVILVQVFLFIPKVFPPLWRWITKRQKAYKPSVTAGIISSFQMWLERRESTTQMIVSDNTKS